MMATIRVQAILRLATFLHNRCSYDYIRLPPRKGDYFLNNASDRRRIYENMQCYLGLESPAGVRCEVCRYALLFFVAYY
jgi:hypothetical protein